MKNEKVKVTFVLKKVKGKVIKIKICQNWLRKEANSQCNVKERIKYTKIHKGNLCYLEPTLQANKVL